ncbi:hypothetical protein ThrDRAFT_00982 [Frankia casuarinae]|uniref:Glycosyl transferase, family 2 n=1 Tax=Frankia casuarinae (strain DSM 45818 / CECT 9043 / HFP020203 / CcI3) TaxID=106370 RepID=Q2JDG4_FRACC|nr:MULTISPECIES: glycosyltransferase family 2 protein [Frankia]ABD10678.1 glycosyl transferase, family 2 [Frankia casuarinae]ETA02943.1 hypothetical protein CcI6DRAFT_01692 [Frankia sp. CcI6]EYT93433.1 hypothetical protein ThrDRAFT_00982 [Frankia casuarinae]KDA43554.1 hypothetical protein BMG523Draft_01673 [Frankia sp. BMG5.23]KEZ36768.1 glycosyl transferase [Frankia sp. CeD]
MTTQTHRIPPRQGPSFPAAPPAAPEPATPAPAAPEPAAPEPATTRTPRRANWPTPYDTAAPAGSTQPQPAPGSVPVTAIILAHNEAPNIVRAIRSAGWCRQVVVVDSGSTDGTADLARAIGATVWHEPWRGFAGQRQWAMTNPGIAHDWVYFLDSDEWVSTALAAEIAARLGTADCAAYSQRRRLVFEGRWIAHCGWYANSWQARLLDRRVAYFDAAVTYSERAVVTGEVGRLSADLIDEDHKGLAAWLRKHVRYAELEAARRVTQPAVRERLARVREEVRRPTGSTRPLTRTIARDVIFPLVPAKPAVLFCYMYLLRSGWRDGRQGLLFCLYYAWYELTIGALTRSVHR